MATVGGSFLRNQMLSALNRLKRIEAGKMKLPASESSALEKFAISMRMVVEGSGGRLVQDTLTTTRHGAAGWYSGKTQTAKGESVIQDAVRRAQDPKMNVQDLPSVRKAYEAMGPHTALGKVPEFHAAAERYTKPMTREERADARGYLERYKKLNKPESPYAKKEISEAYRKEIQRVRGGHAWVEPPPPPPPPAAPVAEAAKPSGGMLKKLFGLFRKKASDLEKDAKKKDKKPTYPISRFLTSPEARAVVFGTTGGLAGLARSVRRSKGLPTNLRVAEAVLNALGGAAIGGTAEALTTSIRRRIHARAIKGRRALRELAGYEKGSADKTPMLSQVKSLLEMSKPATITKRIPGKAELMKGVKEGAVPPTSSHSPGLVRKAGKIDPMRDGTNPKLAEFLLGKGYGAVKGFIEGLVGRPRPPVVKEVPTLQRIIKMKRTAPKPAQVPSAEKLERAVQAHEPSRALRVSKVPSLAYGQETVACDWARGMIKWALLRRAQ